MVANQHPNRSFSVFFKPETSGDGQKKSVPFGGILKIFYMANFLFCLNLLSANPSPAEVKLLSVTELSNRLNEPRCAIVDTRSFIAYRCGHIKGAVSLDAGCGGPLVDKNGAFPCRLRPGKEILGELADRGISSDRQIILYGDQHSWGAEGRLYWLLDKLGFDNLALLDGGYDAWQRAAGPTAALFADRLPACSKLKDDGWQALDSALTALSATALWRGFARGEVIFLDVRSRQEYEGAILYREKRGGHLPAALHFNWEDFRQEDCRLKKPEAVLAELKQQGLPDPAAIGNKTIIPYCTGGIRSGYAWFVLKWLGYAKVENYDPGFWEWAADSALPVEK